MKLMFICALWLTTSFVAAETQTCMNDLAANDFNFNASSETNSYPASGLFSKGWCAGQTTDPYIDLQFKNVMGVKAFTVGLLDGQQDHYPKRVKVQYTPIGSNTFEEFPVPGGLVIKMDKPSTTTFTLNPGMSMFRLRFILEDFEKEPCMKIALKGCTLKELCPVCVQGTCVAENQCQCRTGYTGSGCDREECKPVPLGLGNGSLPGNQITVSSEMTPFTKEEIRLDSASTRRGWCPAETDKSPWVSIVLDKPMAVGVLQFAYPLKDATFPHPMYMREFELLYIAPQDSTRMLRSFHEDIPSLNGTHYFSVTLQPSLITDTVYIRPSKAHVRACFKLELYGCDPKGMCSQNWCMNNGSCVGENVCACASGFFGERCELTKTEIPTVNTTFLSITNNVLITTSLHFTVSGTVTLAITNQIPILFLTGLNSFIQLKETSTAIACLKDINKCTTGFTFAIDVKFDKLLDNTYIISSGGDLPNHHGIALHYTMNTLVYIVTTTNLRWTLHVPYTPVLNVWQHFEITWNKNIGMELHLNGHLLGTVGRPDPVSTSQTANLCLGCSHTTIQVEISMHIKEFHVWTIDRTELVNAGLKPTPAPTPAPGASTATPTSSTKAISPTTPAPVVTTPANGYQEYNFTFITIVGNLLITPAFNFTLHGKPTLELEPNSHTAIVLDCTKNQYVELPDHGIPCIEDMSDCSKGFTFKMEVQFTSIDVTQKTYILSSGGDVETSSGMAIYLHSNQLIFGVKQGSKHWSAFYDMGTVKTNVWYSFEISWSNEKGINVVIDGYEVIKDNDWTPSPVVAKTNPVLIGKTAGANTTSCMKVRDLFTWTTHRDVLVNSGILQNTPIMTSSTSTASSTTTPTTTSIPTTTAKRDPLTPYDLICIRQQDNVLYTREHSLTFLSHGNPVLTEIVPSILYTMTLNSLTGDYLELRNKGVTCVDNFVSCKEGFTGMVKVSIVSSSQSSKTYIVSNGGENVEKSGLYLYHQGSHITFGFRYETHLWETSKPYIFISGVLYTCIFSWSEPDGLLLYINNQIVGAAPKPVIVHQSPLPGVLTIGKTIGSTTTTTIFDLKIWVTSFQTLLDHTVFTTLPTTTQSTTTVSATQPSTTDALHGLVSSSSYNLTFTSIQNNILYTPKYTFTVIGSPVLNTLASGQTALKLNSSRGDYIELSNQTIPCLTDLANCSKGLTFHIKVNLLQTDPTKKIYIVGNGGIQQGTETLYLYYLNHKLYFGNTVGNLKWSSEIRYEIKTQVFQTIELSWSFQHGIQLFINGFLLQSSNVTSQVNTSSPPTNTISIGKTPGGLSTFMIMITDLHFWSVSRHILTAANVITTTIPIEMSTSSHPISATQQKTTKINAHSSTTRKLTTPTPLPSSLLTLTSTSAPSTREHTTSSHVMSSETNTLFTQVHSTSPVHISTEHHIFQFLNITGNTIVTTSFTLTAHGNIHIVHIENNQTAIKLNASNGEYIELKNSSSSCAETINRCHGFVNSIKFNFLSIDQTIKIYIFKGPGLFLYYQNGTLHFAYSVGNELWTSYINFEILVNQWHTFKLTWSTVTGLSFIVDGHLLQRVNESVQTSISSNHTQTFAIGLVPISTSMSFLITGFEIQRETYTLEKTSPSVTSLSTTVPISVTQSPQTAFTPSDYPSRSSSETTHIFNVTTKSSHTALTDSTKSISKTSPILQSTTQFPNTAFTVTDATSKRFTGTTPMFQSTSHSFHTVASTSTSASNRPTETTLIFESTTHSPSSVFISSYSTPKASHDTTPVFQSTTDQASTSTQSTSTTLNATSINSQTTFHVEPSTFSSSYTSKQEESSVRTTFDLGQSTHVTQPDVEKTSHKSTIPEKSTISSLKTTSIEVSSTPGVQTTADSIASSTDVETPPISISSTAFSKTTYMNMFTTSKPYNLGFINITDQKIFTHSYTFTVHGNITLFTLTTGQNVVQINSSKHEYIELKNQSIPCVDNQHACTAGLSFQINIKFINIDYNKVSYIIQSTGNTHVGAGLFLYVLNSTFYIGYTFHNLSWTTNIHYELKTENWYEFKLTWSQSTGLGLYINGKLVIITNKPNKVDVVGIPSSLTIGMNLVNVITTFQTYGIKIWPYVHETGYPSTLPSTSYKSTSKENNEKTTLMTSKTISSSSSSSATDKTIETSTTDKITVTSTLGTDKSTQVSNAETSKNTHPGVTTEKTTQVSIRPTDSVNQTSTLDKDSTTISASTLEAHKSTESPTTITYKTKTAATIAVTSTIINLSTTSASRSPSPSITTVARPISSEPAISSQSSTNSKTSTIAYNTGSTNTGEQSTAVYYTTMITNQHTDPTVSTNKPISFESHNFSFINITGNLIYTTSFVISTHGIVTLVKTSSNETAVKLNGTIGSFIELKTPNISCIDSHVTCKNGLTVKVKVNFLTIKVPEKTYIVVSSGSTPGQSGIVLYYQNKTLYFTSIFQNRTWEASIHFEIKQNVWHTYELSWSLSYGLGLYIDGTLVKSTNVSSSTTSSVPSQPGSLIIGTALGANYSASLLVTGLHIWSASREIVYQAHAQSTEPSPPTTTPTTPTTTTTTPKPTTTKPTTTQPPVPSFSWNFTHSVNVTINGNVPIKDGGLYFTNATQYIDFGNGTLGCLLNPSSCKDGLTVQFTIVFKRVEENTYLLTSGGQLPNGMGLAIIFRFNYYQFILSTSTQSWYATCHRSELTPNKPHNIMISWQLNLGLEVFINNILINSNKNPTTHVSTSVSITNVYFGKQTSTVVVGNTVKVEYILQTITFWYAHIHILVEGGYCKPPVRPTEKPTTVVPVTTAKPLTTQKQTSSVTTMFTKGSTQQCPVGCVSIASTKQPTATPTTKPTTTKKPATPKPTTTTKNPTTPKPTNPTPPPPNTATPSPKPTTERGPPNYTTKPTLEPIVSNDTKAYLVCVFKASSRDVQFIVQLKVDGVVVDQIVNPGQSGVVMFEVSKLNENLYGKEIVCSVVAKYVGGTHTTGPFPSTVLKPGFTVTGKNIIVVEGKSTQFVTVTSTVPPHFYCCKGCQGRCQVHIVGSNNFNHRQQQKCNNNYIAQSLIVSSKPPTSSSPICGFALTNQNWNLHNKIEVKATIDNRRDGDHTNTMSILGHVYNQRANVQISAKPSYSFTISSVQVTAKDNHASSTCKSVNDPHMRTFDGMNYNNMNEGVFVLYRHKSLPFEVRALYHKCNKRGSATCNCGVAVQSGDDVITVTGCHGTNNDHPGQGHGIGLIMQQLFGHKKDELAKTPMTIQIYKNGEFTPGTLIRRFGCGQKYEIELPTGMVVTVQQSYKPFINIYIRGASTDKGESEGLCGNFDGSRNNDLKPSTAAFINTWKSTYENFFFGVAVSSVQFQATYCSCIKDKTRTCLTGIGAMRCVRTNNDITTSLVKQAKRPILTRHKRQAVNPALPATDIPTDEGPLDNTTVAHQTCMDSITNSDVTGSCQPVLTSNITEHIQNCVDDYEATGSYEWAKDALRDIAVECIDNINDIKLANESGNTNITDELPEIPDNIDEILNKSCVDDCGNHGSCVQGVCVCDDGYSGVTCDISKATVPTTSIVPFLCDMSSTSDCQGAMVFGENFVDTPSLTCHYEFATVDNAIRPSGDEGTVPATFISINQVECPLTRSQTALLTVSNDGQNPSSNASMQVIFNSICHTCSVDEQTFKASCYRQDNNCIIDGTCFASEATRPGDQCQVCRPATNHSQWSQSLDTICQDKPQASFVDDDDTDKNTTIALAVVCGVLAAIIVIGAICLIRKKGMSKKSKGEFGSYDFTPTPSVHRQHFAATDNPAYANAGEKM